jgi:hypothetical protein
LVEGWNSYISVGNVPICQPWGLWYISKLFAGPVYPSEREDLARLQWKVAARPGGDLMLVHWILQEGEGGKEVLLDELGKIHDFLNLLAKEALERKPHHVFDAWFRWALARNATIPYKAIRKHHLGYLSQFPQLASLVARYRLEEAEWREAEWYADDDDD